MWSSPGGPGGPALCKCHRGPLGNEAALSSASRPRPDSICFPVSIRALDSSCAGSVSFPGDTDLGPALPRLQGTQMGSGWGSGGPLRYAIDQAQQRHRVWGLQAGLPLTQSPTVPVLSPHSLPRSLYTSRYSRETGTERNCTCTATQPARPSVQSPGSASAGETTGAVSPVSLFPQLPHGVGKAVGSSLLPPHLPPTPAVTLLNQEPKCILGPGPAHPIVRQGQQGLVGEEGQQGRGTFRLLSSATLVRQRSGL